MVDEIYSDDYQPIPESKRSVVAGKLHQDAQDLGIASPLEKIEQEVVSSKGKKYLRSRYQFDLLTSTYATGRVIVYGEKSINVNVHNGSDSTMMVFDDYMFASMAIELIGACDFSGLRNFYKSHQEAIKKQGVKKSKGEQNADS